MRSGSDQIGYESGEVLQTAGWDGYSLRHPWDTDDSNIDDFQSKLSRVISYLPPLSVFRIFPDNLSLYQCSSNRTHYYLEML